MSRIPVSRAVELLGEELVGHEPHVVGVSHDTENGNPVIIIFVNDQPAAEHVQGQWKSYKSYDVRTRLIGKLTFDRS